MLAKETPEDVRDTGGPHARELGRVGVVDALVDDLELAVVAPAPRVALVVRVDAHDVVQVIGRQVEEIAGALDDLVRGHRRKVRELLP